MRRSLFFFAFTTIFIATSLSQAADSAAVPAPASAADAAATGAHKLEIYLMLLEPRAMRNPRSKFLGNSQLSVFTPARQTKEIPGIEAYTQTDFTKLGISVDSFLAKAQTAADRRLASLKPELKKDEGGRVRYAVIRGEDPIYASLIIAPGLLKMFEPIFGKEIWLAAPDRNALYIFPPNHAVVEDFAADLEDRYSTATYPSSQEIFVLKDDGKGLTVLGNFKKL